MPKSSRLVHRDQEAPQPHLFPASHDILTMRPRATLQPATSHLRARRNAAIAPADSLDPIEPLLDVGRAAHLLGISVKTLRDWILYRRIDFVKVGTHVKIRPETIRELVNRNTIHAETVHEHLEAPR